MNTNVMSAVERCLGWTEKVMLTFDRGYWGVYERIRIDRNERVCHCRPDCASELARLLALYRRRTGNDGFSDIFDNQLNWLERVQNENGSFFFAFADGTPEYYTIPISFTNDNGKILLNLLEIHRLTGDDRALRMAIRLADYWAENLRPGGTFYSERDKAAMHNLNKGPCFVLWMAAGMADGWKATGDARYLECAKKAFSYARSLISGGRMRTSAEVDADEFWRPVSSENVIALYCFAHAFRAYPEPAWKRACEEILPFTLGLIDPETGAVRNCDARSLSASENNDPDLCDFVYTEGYALNAFIELYEAFGDTDMLVRAERLADWAVSVQCRGESPLWDGAWRGAWSLASRRWAGRCNQRNERLDEGGEFSVYTGWSAFPVCIGLLRLPDRSR